MTAPADRPRRGTAGRRRLLLAATTILLGLLASLVLGEAALRLLGYVQGFGSANATFHVSDPVLGHRGRPNAVARHQKLDFDVLVRLDAHGFRVHETPPPADPAAPRLVVIGDSFTFGWGVDQGEVYTDRLARLMPRWRVVNRGINAVGTVVFYRLFEAEIRDGLRTGDRVLVTLYDNDFGDNLGGFLRARVADGRVERVGPDRVISLSLYDHLSRLSYLFNLVGQAYDMARQVAYRQVYLAPLSLAQPDDNPAVRVMRHYMRAFRDDCAARGIRLAFLLLPGLSALGELHDAGPGRAAFERDARDVFLALARELGVSVIDLLPPLVQAKRDGLGAVFFAHDEHWTAAAHEAVARAIRDRLCRDGAC